MTELYTVQESLDVEDSKELGVDAVFLISSAKPGNGVEQIRDGNLETFWQSDGQAPHVINCHFMQKRTVSHVAIFCNYNADESYTAKKISIKAGTSAHDLTDVKTIDLHEPDGWVIVPVFDLHDKASPLRTHLLSVRIISMHQNGRDTHIRQLKILGPKSASATMDTTMTAEFSAFGLEIR